MSGEGLGVRDRGVRKSWGRGYLYPGIACLSRYTPSIYLLNGGWGWCVCVYKTRTCSTNGCIPSNCFGRYTHVTLPSPSKGPGRVRCDSGLSSTVLYPG